MLKHKATLSLSGILIPLFSLFLSVLFALSLQITALIKMSLSLGVSLALPSIAVALSIVAVLIAQFSIALSLSLPSFVLSLAIAINFELVLVLGFLATLQLLIDAIAEASLVAYGWFGPAGALGGALTSALGSAWPDGTGGEQEITAYLFVATSGGGYSKDQIASIGMMPEPAPPPEPTDPPPPDGAYPPPQAYERGLANLYISPPTGPGGVQATGTVTVTDDPAIGTGIGAITGIAIVEHGSGYTSMPDVQVSDTVAIVSVAPGPPIVLTLPNALSIPIGDGFGISIASADVPPVITLACAKVATATTIELYTDKDMLIPLVGGSFAGGTVTGGGAGAAALVTMGGGAVNALQSLLDGLSWPTSTGLAGGVYTFKAMLATVWTLMLDLQGNLQARANLLGSISVGVDFIPPSISASLEFLAKISANLKANLEVELPNLTVAMSAALSAQIDAVASLVARIGFLLGLATSDVKLEIWEYTGPGSELGAAVSQGPGAVGWNDGTTPSGSVTAAVFGLTNPASVAAFNTMFSGAVA